MDPFSLFAATVIIGMNMQIDKLETLTQEQQSRLNQVEDQMIQLELNMDAFQQNQEAWNMKMAGEHSAFAARTKVDQENTDKSIEILERMLENNRNKIDYLDEKMLID
jgi:predicted RNase H-like nuclease (RuvC/YqgF family)